VKTTIGLARRTGYRERDLARARLEETSQEGIDVEKIGDPS
jgi:hypothetical protein